jgi:hypothetical protein
MQRDVPHATVSDPAQLASYEELYRIAFAAGARDLVDRLAQHLDVDDVQQNL